MERLIATEPLEALVQEQEQLEDVLLSLDDEDAAGRESACPGWTVCDVVLHLAQTEEMVVASITGEGAPEFAGGGASTVDELMARWVETERSGSFEEVRERWMEARRAALGALGGADPSASFTWAAAPLKPRTLATTRLSEHWIHAQDVAAPLGIDYPDTERLWHIARLAHRTIPYAFIRAGAEAAPDVFVELKGPAGDDWTFGEPSAQVRIEGDAGQFCRVAARRMDASAATGLSVSGERADEVMNLVRTYA